MARSAVTVADFSCRAAPSKECLKKNLVLDMGGVLMKWDGGASRFDGIINPKLFNHMLQDTIWNEYETGKLATQQAYDQLSEKFAVPVENIRTAATIAIEGFAPIRDMMNIIDEYRGKVRLFCMTNVPEKEFEYVHRKFPEVWQHFEMVFTSAAVGLRKPNLEFFRHVLREARINPAETVLVDDSFQNCVAARSLGITAVLCERIPSAVQQIHFFLRSEEDRLLAARRYLDHVLEHERQDLDTVSNKGARLSDNFSEFYIVEVLGDTRFLPHIPIPANGELHYTRETDMYKWILFPLPNDLDTTSVGMSVLYTHGLVSLEFINSVAEHMMDFTSEDGIIQTYFDRSRPRTCHAVLANVTTMFHMAGRRPPAACVDFLYNVLLNKAYLEGSQYYIGPAPFIYFLSRTAAKFRENHFLPRDFVPLCTARVQELMGTQTDDLAIAMIILACLNLQIDPDVRDVERLARAQNADGSWANSHWMKANVLTFGTKALTAAFAFAALQGVRDLRASKKPLLKVQ